jgi:hypothetical protein
MSVIRGGDWSASAVVAQEETGRLEQWAAVSGGGHDSVEEPISALRSTPLVSSVAKLAIISLSASLSGGLRSRRSV